MTDNRSNESYAALGPDAILDAVESLGYLCNGQFLALNSYENRVYQVGIEDDEPLIAKFYRPARWSDEAIIEEHHFTQALSDLEIPVVAPIADRNGTTLHSHNGYRFSLSLRRGGRSPELDDPDQLEQMGRFMARIHNMGAAYSFKYRPTLNIENFGVDSYQYLLEKGFVPEGLTDAYRSLAEELIKRVRICYANAGDVEIIRLHGDMHPGNVLWRDNGPHIVDFDDARMGPALQDIWMFLSGDRPYMTARLTDFLNGYIEFREFDPKELHLLEALRTLRMMHYAAWIARRWNDPAFPQAFPWFNSGRYWDEHILALREQAALMDEPPLVWD
ncbi:MAG TPA: serine/threonine protein kinase [Chromatiales bacterium]|nr:serine/threonine protein kinase [Chromatiales bacterium]